MRNELFNRTISSIILILLSIFVIVKGSVLLILFLLVCFFISLYEWNKMNVSIFVKILGIIFLIFSFYSVYQINSVFNSNYNYLLFVLGICVATDIGGFFFGKKFKGPKLTKISPNKTYSGMIGSYLFAIIFAFFFTKVTGLYILITSNHNLFVLTLLLSTISQIGDIIISFFKRISNIKDTGKIIPGHGGILDRIDGMVFTFPAAYLIISLKILEIF